MGFRSMGVTVLGGGVAGMSAAHELAERGFRVTVLEAKDVPGGKARSIFVPGTGTEGRRGFPGEHGFRFFPSFYRHLPDTMSRIPCGRGSVADNLVATSRTMIAREDPPLDLEVLAHFPRSLEDLRSLAGVAPEEFGIPGEDWAFFLQRLLVILTSCWERRVDEYDATPWTEFMEVDERSEAFRRFITDVSVRFLVAMDAGLASTKTIGNIGLQLYLGHLTPGGTVDRLLNGPTHDVWLEPWLAHLRALGVDYRTGSRVEHIRVQNDRAVEVRVRGPDGKTYSWTDDFFVAAVPLERMLPLVTDEMLESEPRLEKLEELSTDWMVGIQFFLDVDVELAHGHLVFVDCPWGLTAISQKQFWPDVDLSRFGNGEADGVLSVVLSCWDEPGDQTGKCARDCTREEIIGEVWEELKRHLNDDRVHLEDDNVVYAYLADSIEFGEDGAHNGEPLLINTAGSWALRPEAVTGIRNLFLASDYVRTHTDLATMEGANEAARRAVNGILDATDSPAPRCRIWPLREPRVFEPAKALDLELHRRGKPHFLMSDGRGELASRLARRAGHWAARNGPAAGVAKRMMEAFRSFGGLEG